MTIKERMASCQLFANSDTNYSEEAAELEKARQRGKALCYEINNLHPDEVKKRFDLMKQLFGDMGDHIWLEPPIKMSYGSNTTLGNKYLHQLQFNCCDDYKVTIGNSVMFGPK